MPKSMLLVLFSLVLTACATSQQPDEAVNSDVAVINGRAENALKEILVPIGTKGEYQFPKDRRQKYV
jgi:hypothetical protein